MSDVREELELAAFIREIDGNNKMGASQLAEKILDWQAARAQGWEAVAEIQDYGSDSLRATVRHLVDLRKFPHGTKLYVRHSNTVEE